MLKTLLMSGQIRCYTSCAQTTFKILGAKRGDEPETILKGQTVTNAKPYRISIQKSDIGHKKPVTMISEYIRTGGEKETSYTICCKYN